MFLDAIVEDVDARVQRLLPVARYLREQAEAMPPVRSLKAALTHDDLAIIAECKQRSPSRGWLTDDYDPQTLACRYQEQGARAISVLTEPQYFAGELRHLQAVRHAVTVPVLRKDFIRHPVQIFEARADGADAVLIIVRIVDDERLKDLCQTAQALGLEALVEVHSAQEVERALNVNPAIVGVNNRDLDTFDTRIEFSRDMAGVLPPDIVRVSESGLGSREDLMRVRSWGYQAVLIGESLMRGGNLLAAWAHDMH